MPSYDAPPVRQRGAVPSQQVAPIATEEWAVRLSPRNGGSLKASLALGFNGSRRDGATGLAAGPGVAHCLKACQQRAIGRHNGSDQSQ